jgi:pyoverdine/dityrosine biosynthesis protein Dit1
MNKEFVPYEQALAIYELGFDDPCFAQWDEMQLYPLQQGGESAYFETNKNSRLSFNTMAPLYQQAFRFFRENYKLYSYIEPTIFVDDNSIVKYDYVILVDDNSPTEVYNNLPCDKFEDAELECLKKLIKIVKQKQ